MNLHFLHPFKLDLREEPPEVEIHQTEQNTSEGSEFLDDGLRMEDLLLSTPPEQSIAAGSPRYLL
jgi:hypothetical protein